MSELPFSSEAGGAGGAGGAGAINAMLSEVVAPGGGTAAPASSPMAGPHVGRAQAVRPLWSADASAPQWRWLQSRRVWAVLGLLVGIAGTSLVRDLYQQAQREVALASHGRIVTGAVALVPAPASVEALRPAATLPAAAKTDAAAAAVAVPEAASAPAMAAPAAEPPAVEAAPVKAASRKPAPRPDSPASRCTVRTNPAFERCLQAQCQRAKFVNHRQCVALRERAAER